MTTPWSNWFDYVMPELPGCTTAMAALHLRRAAIELCTDTGVHAKELAAVNVTAGVAEYTMASGDAEIECFMVLAAWFNGAPLEFAPLDALDAGGVRWQDQTAATPNKFTQLQYNTLRLVPTPSTSATAALTIRAACRPVRASSGVADHIAGRFFEGIANGAKGALMLMPDKPWTNSMEGARYAALFAAEKTSASILQTRSYTRNSLSVQMRPAA